MYLQTSGELTQKTNSFSGKEVRKVRSPTVCKTIRKKASCPERTYTRTAGLNSHQKQSVPYLRCSTPSVTEHTDQSETALHAHYTASARCQRDRRESWWTLREQESVHCWWKHKMQPSGLEAKNPKQSKRTPKTHLNTWCVFTAALFVTAKGGKGSHAHQRINVYTHT